MQYLFHLVGTSEASSFNIVEFPKTIPGIPERSRTLYYAVVQELSIQKTLKIKNNRVLQENNIYKAPKHKMTVLWSYGIAVIQYNLINQADKLSLKLR